MQLDPKRYTS
ncbi:hypothetical protein ACHAWF_000270, partial [Thalassiosira exigua]